METEVRPCTCKHEFQDREYGRGMRVHNLGKDKARCTVCSAEKSRGGAGKAG